MKKKLIFISSSLILILVLVGAGIYTSVIKLPFTSTMHASWAFDVSNIGLLVKYSDNVFIGRVVAQVGSEPRGNTPFTQFSVDVLGNIKGELRGSVIVDQMGGYKYGVLHVLQGDTIIPEKIATPGEYLLLPGHVYLFSTKQNKEKTRYTLSAPTDHTRISTDPTLPNDVALAAAWEHPRVHAFVEAVERGEQDTAVLMGFPPLPTIDE